MRSSEWAVPIVAQLDVSRCEKALTLRQPDLCTKELRYFPEVHTY